MLTAIHSCAWLGVQYTWSILDLIIGGCLALFVLIACIWLIVENEKLNKKRK
jgi:hypothetical protein